MLLHRLNAAIFRWLHSLNKRRWHLHLHAAINEVVHIFFGRILCHLRLNAAINEVRHMFFSKRLLHIRLNAATTDVICIFFS